MESRRIAGWIFAVAAVAVPVLASAMNLTIPQPIGFAGLAICLTLLLLGLALVFAPQPKSQAEVEADQRKRVRDDLGRFMITGQHLRRTMADLEHEPVFEDADRWLEELCAYLQENLGVAYVARVNDGSSVPLGMSSLIGERVKYDGGLRVRLYHLDQFLRELA